MLHKATSSILRPSYGHLIARREENVRSGVWLVDVHHLFVHTNGGLGLIEDGLVTLVRVLLAGRLVAQRLGS